MKSNTMSYMEHHIVSTYRGLFYSKIILSAICPTSVFYLSRICLIPIEASIKTKVIQQWLSGDSRQKIAIDNDIGEGTVGTIINYFKIGLMLQSLIQPGN
jgi:hypothetical protein